ncbi:MAG: hypothetical protein M3Q34_04215 [bacterium]|nr:hypothetical protein [bacterium]
MDQNINIYQYPGQPQQQSSQTQPQSQPQFQGQQSQSQTQPQSQPQVSGASTGNEPMVDTLPAHVLESGQNPQSNSQQAQGQLAETQSTQSENPQAGIGQTATVSQALEETPESEASGGSFGNYLVYILGAVLLFYLIKKMVEIWKRKFKMKLQPLPGEDSTTLCEVCNGTGRKQVL